MTAKRDEENGAGDVGDVVKAAEYHAEQFAGERAADLRRAGLQHLEGGGCDDRTEHDHPAQPDDQRDQVDVPQREHQVIIMTLSGGSPCQCRRPRAYRR